jgi:hypothetical protein
MTIPPALVEAASGTKIWNPAPDLDCYSECKRQIAWPSCLDGSVTSKWPSVTSSVQRGSEAYLPRRVDMLWARPPEDTSRPWRQNPALHRGIPSRSACCHVRVAARRPSRRDGGGCRAACRFADGSDRQANPGDWLVQVALWRIGNSAIMLREAQTFC